MTKKKIKDKYLKKKKIRTISQIEKRKLRKARQKLTKKAKRYKKLQKRALKSIGIRIRKRGKEIIYKIPRKKQKEIKKKYLGRIKIKTVGKSREISKVFKKGISKIVIPDILSKGTSELNKEYKQLFKNVLDRKGLGVFATEEVLNAMIKQENINKVKSSFEIRANVYDRDGTMALAMTKGSGGDLMTLREKMAKGIWKGASVDYDIDVGDDYVFKLVNKGNVDRVQVTVIFRS